MVAYALPWCFHDGPMGTFVCGRMVLQWCLRGASTVPHGSSMEAWFFCGACMVTLPWFFHGGLMLFHGASVVLPWCLHGTYTGACFFHGTFMDSHRGICAFMMAQWWFFGASIVPSWRFRGGSEVNPWWSLSALMNSHSGLYAFVVLPWRFYRASLALPLYLHGAFVLPWCFHGSLIDSHREYKVLPQYFYFAFMEFHDASGMENSMNLSWTDNSRRAGENTMKALPKPHKTTKHCASSRRDERDSCAPRDNIRALHKYRLPVGAGGASYPPRACPVPSFAVNTSCRVGTVQPTMVSSLYTLACRFLLYYY